MRCLYCGKPLPLLKKLTGGGEFCSDAHRHKYQEEYNKLALSRLLQAQSPGAEGAPSRTARQLPVPALRPGQRALPPPQTRQIAAPALPPTAPPKLPPSIPNEAPPPSFQPFEPPPRAAAAPPFPTPPPLPDPPYAPFRLAMLPPFKPEKHSNVFVVEPLLPGDDEAASSPQFHLESALAPEPLDWETLKPQVEEFEEPVPPEARPWEHPISFAIPAPIQPLLMLEAEFETVPLFPSMPEQDIPIRYPRPVLRKAAMPPTVRAPLTPGQPEIAVGRSWEVSLSLPEWKPKLSVVPASAIASAPEPVLDMPKPRQNEVYIDLSILEKLGLA